MNVYLINLINLNLKSSFGILVNLKVLTFSIIDLYNTKITYYVAQKHNVLYISSQ